LLQKIGAVVRADLGDKLAVEAKGGPPLMRTVTPA
jgi:hypothetical protein